MASIISEYLDRNLSIIDLQNELQRLIGLYHNHTGKHLLVFASDIEKGRIRGVDISMGQEDFYNLQDILREQPYNEIDIYIESPGGSGEAAEEIAKFLRKKFDTVNFVIAGEAKSAATILVLSGDNISMAETGSLGPIDAQIKIGRSVVSAHDYKEWVDKKRIEAEKNNKLNPLDAIMVAQITPGELNGVINSLEFAKDLVKEWLENYKFKNWTVTNTRKKKVTADMKKIRANEVAEMLCDHTSWRTHGRSLKIEDLKEVLKIDRIDDDSKLSEIVYRIKTILRLIFSGSTIYKLYFLENFKLAKTFTPQGQSSVPINTLSLPKKFNIEKVEIDITCPKCSKRYRIPGYLNLDPKKIKEMKLPINKNISENDILICDNCNFALDLKPIKNQIENQSKKKVIFK